jgi:hypothetical protein
MFLYIEISTLDVPVMKGSTGYLCLRVVGRIEKNWTLNERKCLGPVLKHYLSVTYEWPV